jgi:uncharacterized protein with HEPN domain
VSREWSLYLADMIDACHWVSDFTAGVDKHSFLQDRKTYDATVRNLEVLGEACKRIPEDIRAQHPQVPWREIAGFRDVLAHAYFGIDEDLLWDVVSNKVPLLLTQLEVMAAAADHQT